MSESIAPAEMLIPVNTQSVRPDGRFITDTSQLATSMNSFANTELVCDAATIPNNGFNNVRSLVPMLNYASKGPLAY
ncbi:hypothetical protein [Yersinia pekkanenii]|uniref:hypothetical protein n=1 Tax=Yersinia pekkanenii TaxID=1288385 RepID=UPI00066FBBFD|nr:hypothetical protein [Yersinia pekkanenii]